VHRPQPSPEHLRLHRLAGTWSGDEKILPSPWDPKGGPARGTLRARVDLDGFFLVTEYVEERDGEVCYRGHGVYGWNGRDGCYTMHWFDSLGDGSPAPARGRWEGDRLVFESQGPLGFSRYVYDLDGDDAYTFRIENSQDGKSWTALMEALYRRG
jgi:hypothetical protein